MLTGVYCKLSDSWSEAARPDQAGSPWVWLTGRLWVTGQCVTAYAVLGQPGSLCHSRKP